MGGGGVGVGGAVESRGKVWGVGGAVGSRGKVWRWEL